MSNRGAARSVDTVELPGPWRHRYISANGARFHICEAASETAATGVPVLLLHGFPEFWWAWRNQMPALADAGHPTVAMDLRGYGGSDKTPRGYDALTLAADVVGVVRSLGWRSAVLVGSGWGGYVAWAAAASRPDCASGVCAVSAPHPKALTRWSALAAHPAAVRHLLAMQVPWLPERRIRRGSYVAQHLRSWAAQDRRFPTQDEVERYRAAFAQWPSPHCALEYHRWLARSRLRADGRRADQLLCRPLSCPVAYVTGDRDPTRPERGASASAAYVTGPFTAVTVPATGHFVAEESPGRFTAVLLGWLSESAAARGDACG